MRCLLQAEGPVCFRINGLIVSCWPLPGSFATASLLRLGAEIGGKKKTNVLVCVLSSSLKNHLPQSHVPPRPPGFEPVVTVQDSRLNGDPSQGV